MQYRVIDRANVTGYDFEVPTITTGYKTLTIDEIAGKIREFFELPNTQRFVRRPMASPIQETCNNIFSRIPDSVVAFPRRASLPLSWLSEQRERILDRFGSPIVELTEDQFARFDQCELIDTFNNAVRQPVREDKTFMSLLIGDPSKVIDALLTTGVDEKYVLGQVKKVMAHEQVHMKWAQIYAEMYGFEARTEMFLELFRHPLLEQGKAATILGPEGFVSFGAYVKFAPTRTLGFKTLFGFLYSGANATIEFTNGNGTYSDEIQAKRYLRLLTQGISGEYIDSGLFHQFVKRNE